jgi:Holliday junction resolvase
MAQEKKFGRLTVEHPLVEELASDRHPWWKRLVEISRSDRDINIQVRGSYLNVYCKMGNLLKVYMQGKKVACEVHYKYLVGAHTPEYVAAFPSGNDITVSQKSCDMVSSILDAKNFRIVKQNISTYAGEEKKVQSRLVEKNKETILDVEVAFSDAEVLADNEDGNTRIDIVNFDKNRKCVAFVELKQIFDSRLYSPEMNEQIRKYMRFAEKHEAHLLVAYRNVLKVKQTLGLISEGDYLASAEVQRVEAKPILAIAGYNQALIDGMKYKIVKGNPPLETSNLAGLYFFGNETDLNLKAGKNKEVFPF